MNNKSFLNNIYKIMGYSTKFLINLQGKRKTNHPVQVVLNKKIVDESKRTNAKLVNSCRHSKDSSKAIIILGLRRSY